MDVINPFVSFGGSQPTDTHTVSLSTGALGLTMGGLVSPGEHRLVLDRQQYNIFGQDVNLVRKTVALTFYHYNLSGQDILPLRYPAASLPATGFYTLTGEDVALRSSRLQLAVGIFALARLPVALTFRHHTPTHPHKDLVAQYRAFTITGLGVGTRFGIRPSLERGLFAVTWQTALATKASLASLAQGSYVITGRAVGLVHGYTASLAQGSYSVSGQDLLLEAARTFSLGQGSLALTGEDLGLFYTQSSALGFGSYVITGEDLALTRALVALAAQGSYVISGQAVSLVHGYPLVLAQGSYAITGEDLSFLLGRVVSLAQGSLALTGKNVTLTYANSGPTDVTIDNSSITRDDTLVGTLTMVGGTAPATFTLP